ncbi:hypothetical protein FKP32DRAFT_36284 [Trametes sanguinea]|nr:hypothetical protein FKP32DRAFT_36284 [Trametes sanguinea]
MEYLVARSSPVNLPLKETFGALLLSTFFALMLYGLLVHQISDYFRQYGSDDTTINKTFVSGRGFQAADYIFYAEQVIIILVIETVHSMLLMHACYIYLVANLLNPPTPSLATWSLKVYPVINALCICVAQCFYTRRVYLISARYRGLVALAVTLSAAFVGYNIAATVINYGVTLFYRLDPDAWIGMASYASIAVSDTITTGVLVFNLKQYRTGIKRTDVLLGRLASFAIHTA